MLPYLEPKSNLKLNKTMIRWNATRLANLLNTKKTKGTLTLREALRETVMKRKKVQVVPEDNVSNALSSDKLVA